MALFAGSLHIIFEISEVSTFTQMCLLPLLPILFAPIEGLLLKVFQTTLGKAVFGLSYDRPFDLKSAMILSLKHSILILPLFLPPLNVFFAFFYIKELSQFTTNRWDDLAKEKLGVSRSGRILRSCVISFTLLLSCFTFAPKFSLTQLSNITGIDYFIEGVNASYKSGNLANWKKVDEKELGASAYFPSAPEFSIKKYPVPKSKDHLDLKHYKYADAAHNYSLTYTTLPHSWTKWGSSLVLGVGINHVVDKKTIVHKKKCKHYNFPALEYKTEKNGKTTTGLLVLVNSTMYKVEFEQNSDIAALDSEVENGLLDAFFGSFKPMA